MNNLMVLDEKAKNRIGIICFVPIVAFAICFVYYMILLLPMTDGHNVPAAMVGITHNNYDVLLVMLAIAATITAPIFIYCLVLLARFRHLNAADKLMWIVFLSVLAPVASALFWLLMIRKAPKYLPTYPDIA